MFVSCKELFKIGIGPSSSHTLGPLLAAREIRRECLEFGQSNRDCRVICNLWGSLSATGAGHKTPEAVCYGLLGINEKEFDKQGADKLYEDLVHKKKIIVHSSNLTINFDPRQDIRFCGHLPDAKHPNCIEFEIFSDDGALNLRKRFYSVGGGFLVDDNMNPISQLQENRPLRHKYNSFSDLMACAEDNEVSIADIHFDNEVSQYGKAAIYEHTLETWTAMKRCLMNGLEGSGTLDGGLNVQRRAKTVNNRARGTNLAGAASDILWLSSYAIAVNEENAAGSQVVTSPTNGAAGVIPAVLSNFFRNNDESKERVYDFMFTAAAVGGVIKNGASISGAECGCQAEVGSASAMAAAGLTAVLGGSNSQIENAAEIALEHHLGMTCDPIGGLVQIPCIERNAFGAIKAYSAAHLAISGEGKHYVSLDNCVRVMYETGRDMRDKYKETSEGGLALIRPLC